MKQLQKLCTYVGTVLCVAFQTMWQIKPELSPLLQSLCALTSMSSQVLIFYQSEKRRLASGDRCFNSAFCADYCMKEGQQTEEKQWMQVSLIHSARSN